MLTETSIDQLRVALDLPQTLDGQEVITRLANKKVVPYLTQCERL